MELGQLLLLNFVHAALLFVFFLTLLFSSLKGLTWVKGRGASRYVHSAIRCELRSASAARRRACAQLWPAGRLASYPVLSTPYQPSFLSLELDSVLLYSLAGDISVNL